MLSDVQSMYNQLWVILFLTLQIKKVANNNNNNKTKQKTKIQASNNKIKLLPKW